MMEIGKNGWERKKWLEAEKNDSEQKKMVRTRKK
jgi:hypothetical protein